MLKLFIGAIIAVTPASGLCVTYDELMSMAINECPNAYWDQVNEEIIENLVYIEENYFERYEISEGLRGMLLAAACIESGYNPEARGDWATAANGKKHARARGIVQLWPWWSKKYKIDRDNYKDSAKAWMAHIVKQRHKIEKLRWGPAKFSDEKKWVVAWVQTARGRANRASKYRCHEVPAHYKLLKKWHKQITTHRHSNACEC